MHSLPFSLEGSRDITESPMTIQTVLAVEVAPSNLFLRNRGISHVVFHTMGIGARAMVTRSYARSLDEARRDYRGIDVEVIAHDDPRALDYRTN
jgi:hypothetical protein